MWLGVSVCASEAQTVMDTDEHSRRQEGKVMNYIFIAPNKSCICMECFFLFFPFFKRP